MSTTDDGVTWTAVRRVPINDGADHFIPGIGVNPGTTDQLGLTYYYYANPACGKKQGPPCELSVGYVQSNDGGATWSDKQVLAGPFPVAWTPDTSQGRMVGDYISTSWLNGRAFGAFAVASRASGRGVRPEDLRAAGRRARDLLPKRESEGAVVLRQRRSQRQPALGDPAGEEGGVRLSAGA